MQSIDTTLSLKANKTALDVAEERIHQDFVKIAHLATFMKEFQSEKQSVKVALTDFKTEMKRIKLEIDSDI